jgi:hypothetical protein
MAPRTPRPLDDTVPGPSGAGRHDTSPGVLDVPDTPDPFTERDPSPRPADGPQDVSQDPNGGPPHGTPGDPTRMEA